MTSTVIKFPNALQYTPLMLGGVPAFDNPRNEFNKRYLTYKDAIR